MIRKANEGTQRLDDIRPRRKCGTKKKMEAKT
jgi:hypothetical protein